MRVAWIAFIGTIVLTASITLSQLASAQTPTPTVPPTDTPSPAPTPTPYLPKSTITIRFVTGGEPTTAVVGTPKIYADGVLCNFPTTGQPAESRSEVAFPWPPNPSPNFAPECTKGPPTQLRLDFGSFAADLNWAGSDVTADVEVPASTPSTTPIPVLPKTGGPPDDRGSPMLWLLAVAMAVSIGALAFARSRIGSLLSSRLRWP
jgi:hypothetical protein